MPIGAGIVDWRDVSVFASRAEIGLACKNPRDAGVADGVGGAGGALPCAVAMKLPDEAAVLASPTASACAAGAGWLPTDAAAAPVAGDTPA